MRVSRRYATVAISILLAVVIFAFLHWRRVPHVREIWERQLRDGAPADGASIRSIDWLSNVVNVSVVHPEVGIATEAAARLAGDASWRDAAWHLDLYGLVRAYRSEFWFGARALWKTAGVDDRLETRSRRRPPPPAGEDAVAESAPAPEPTDTNVAQPASEDAADRSAETFVVQQPAGLWLDPESILDCLANDTLRAFRDAAENAKLRDGAAGALEQGSGRGDPCTRNQGTLSTGTEIERIDSNRPTGPADDPDDDRKKVRVLSGDLQGKVGYFQMTHALPKNP